MSEWLTMAANVYKPQPKSTKQSALSTPNKLESSLPTSLTTSCGARWLSGTVELCAIDLHAAHLFAYSPSGTEITGCMIFVKVEHNCRLTRQRCKSRHRTVTGFCKSGHARFVVFKHVNKCNITSGLSEGARTKLLKRDEYYQYAPRSSCLEERQCGPSRTPRSQRTARKG
jgi:hypothetical protein